MEPNHADEELQPSTGGNNDLPHAHTTASAHNAPTTSFSSTNSSLPPSMGNVTTTLDDELLVAYLDGELTSQEKASVEAGLKANPAAAVRVAELRRAWDLLDELPTSMPNPELTQTTMEMLRLSIQEEMRARNNPSWRLGRRGLIAILLVATFLVGFLGMRAKQHQANRRLLDDLHLLADWNSFSDIVSIEWLESMETLRAQMENFAHYYPVDPNASLETAANEIAIAVPHENSARETWLHNLPDAKKREIAKAWDKYRTASPKQKERTRKIAERVYSSSNPQQLLQLARIFRAILDNSIGSRRDKLTQPFSSSLDLQAQIDQRLNELEETINVKIGSAYGKSLPNEDRQAIRDWVDSMETRYFQPRSQRARSPVILALKNLEAGYSVIQDADFDELFNSLTPQAQEILSNLDDYLFSVYIVEWVDEAMSTPRPQPKDAELIRQYVLMQDEEREEVDYMDSLNARERLDSKLNRRTSSSANSTDSTPFTNGHAPNSPIEPLNGLDATR